MIQPIPEIPDLTGALVSWTDEPNARRPRVTHTSEIVQDLGPIVALWQGATAPLKYVVRERLTLCLL